MIFNNAEVAVQCPWAPPIPQPSECPAVAALINGVEYVALASFERGDNSRLGLTLLIDRTQQFVP